jgi:excisionase family DNA binding protein
LSNAIGTDRLDLLTVKQVADQLQICTKTVRRLISKLGVPVVTVGRQTRIPAQHLALFLKKKW